MSEFAVYRLEKFKRSACFGIQKERNRENHEDHNFAKSSIDRTQTSFNIVVDGKNEQNFHQSVSTRIQKYGVKERPDSTVFIGAVFTASPSFFTPNPNYKEPQTPDTRTKDERRKFIFDDKAKSFFSECYQFYIQDICKGNPDLIFSAKIDLDETTPHLQIYSVPIIERTNKKGQTKPHLSAKDVLGDRTAMRKRQDRFFETIGQKRGFQRGEKVDWDKTPEERKKHEETHEFKVRQKKEQLEKLEHDCSVLQQENQQLKHDVSVLQREKDEMAISLQEQKKVIEEMAQQVDRVRTSRKELIPISETPERKTFKGVVPATQTFRTSDVEDYKEKTRLAPCDRWTLNDVSRNISKAVDGLESSNLQERVKILEKENDNLRASLSLSRDDLDKTRKHLNHVFDVVERVCGFHIRQKIESLVYGHETQNRVM